MTKISANIARRWPLLLGGAILAALVGAAAFFWLDDREPQDVLIHGLGLDHPEEMYTFLVDGKQVGTGPFLCVPDMAQGKRSIEIRSTTETVAFTAGIGDVGARIVEPKTMRGYEYVELSNCQDQELVRKQTTFPSVSPATSSPVNGSAQPEVR